jgi:cytochrome P450
MMQALRETTVADIRVPAATLIWANMRHDSLGEQHFAGAAAFDPGRWLHSEAGPRATSVNRVAMPFGAGPRVCPGRQLAMLEIKMALATLLGRFEIESVSTADAAAPDELMSFTMTPSPLTMRLRARG